jgi:DNA (cytosine-5)-methyltransferase 1
MIRVFEAFSGIGAQRMALRNLGIEHEIIGISEIDKFAIKSYEAIHGETVNFGDISRINPKELPDFDLFTYSFPCQDLSVAGQCAGMVKGQTRSGLLYECEKIIETKRPKYLLLENVKNLVSKKFKSQFKDWLTYLETLGYKNYWQVLNAKDYGVPQNRERVFVVSILGEHSTYEFPSPIPLMRVIKDILEDDVEERYYMNKPFKLVNKGQNNMLIRAQVEGLNNQNGRVFDSNGICSTLDTMQGGHRQPKILELTEQNYLVRKLTPLECWRLMGFSDEDFKKAKSVGISNTQLYKQAGNSIVVPVLEGIFTQLFKKDDVK